MKTTLSLVALLMGACLLACDSEAPLTQIELELDRVVTIDFGAMTTQVPEDVAIDLGDLRDEPRYVELRDALTCSTVGLDGTFIQVLDLVAEVDAFPFKMDVYVAEGSEAACDPEATEERYFDQIPGFTLLASFDGAVADQELIRFSDPRFTVWPQGTDRLADISLSETPTYCIGVTAQADRDLDSFLVDFNLELNLESLPENCF